MTRPWLVFTWLFLRDAFYISLLVILTFIDLDTMDLPHRFTIPVMVSGVLFAVLGLSASVEIYWSHALFGLAPVLRPGACFPWPSPPWATPDRRIAISPWG